jgi:hypothetical protein
MHHYFPVKSSQGGVTPNSLTRVRGGAPIPIPVASTHIQRVRHKRYPLRSRSCLKIRLTVRRTFPRLQKAGQRDGAALHRAAFRIEASDPRLGVLRNKKFGSNLLTKFKGRPHTRSRDQRATPFGRLLL